MSLLSGDGRLTAAMCDCRTCRQETAEEIRRELGTMDLPVNVFPAKYAGTCPLCGWPIAKGELIVKGAPLDSGTAEVYQHAGCAQQQRAEHLQTARMAAVTRAR